MNSRIEIARSRLLILSEIWLVLSEYTLIRI